MVLSDVAQCQAAPQSHLPCAYSRVTMPIFSQMRLLDSMYSPITAPQLAQAAGVVGGVSVITLFVLLVTVSRSSALHQTSGDTRRGWFWRTPRKAARSRAGYRSTPARCRRISGRICRRWICSHLHRLLMPVTFPGQRKINRRGVAADHQPLCAVFDHHARRETAHLKSGVVFE